MRKSTHRVALSCALALLMGLTAGAQTPANVSGKWEISYQGPRGPVTATMTVEQSGEKIKGTLKAEREIAFAGSVKENKISFTVKGQTPFGEAVVEYNGTVTGETMKGTRKNPRGAVTEWTAKRQK